MSSIPPDRLPDFPDPSRPARSRARVRIVLLAVLVGLALVTYHRALGIPLGSDARFLTWQNAFVTAPGGEGLARAWTSDAFQGAETSGVTYRSGYYRPVLNTLFWLEYRWAGRRDLLYNLLEILLHGANAFLVALLVARLARDRRAGVLAGVLFVVHPVNAFVATEPAARADVLFLAFYLGALLVFDRALDREEDGLPWPALLGTTALYVLSLLTKEMGATLPAVLALLVLLRHFRDGTSLRRLTWTVPAWVAFAGYFVWRFGVLGLDTAVMGYGRAHGRVEVLLAALKTIPIHLARVLVPLQPSYPELDPDLLATVGGGLSDPLAWIALAITGLLGAGAVLLWRRHPLAAFWSAFFLVGFSPLLRVENIGGTLDTGVILTQERWIYLPAVAILGSVAAAVSVLLRRREPLRRPWLVPLGVAGLATVLAWSASVHAGKHEDPFALLRRLYALPQERLSRFERANELLLYAHWVAVPQGDIEEAERRVRGALELVPDSPLTARSAAEVFARVGRWTEVRDLLTPWLDPDPEWLAEQGRTNFRVYDDWNRVNPEVMLLMGRASAHLGEDGEARGYLCEALHRAVSPERVREVVNEAPGLRWPLACPGA